MVAVHEQPDDPRDTAPAGDADPGRTDPGRTDPGRTDPADGLPAPDARRPRSARRASLATVLRRHPRATLVTAGALAFALLGSGAVAAGAASVGTVAPTATRAGGPPEPAPTVTVTTTPEVVPTEEPARAVPAEVPDPTPLRTCSVAAAASDPRLGQFEGSVVDAATGEVLFDRAGSTPARTGSVLKTLTSAVALSVLGPDHRLTTTVTGDAATGSIALVGGGDATLSAGGGSVYPGAPTLSDLAGQVKASLGDRPVTAITLDATAWSTADKWDPSWARSEQTIGYHSEVTALQVDGDRATPSAQTSPRSTDPVGRAGEAFRRALVAAGVPGAATAPMSQGASASSTVLGSVSSQPVSSLVATLLPTSDNTLAEMLARASSRAAGADGSAASLTGVYRQALGSAYGLSVDDITIVDGSGLSEDNAVPATTVAKLMVQVGARQQSLGVVLDALPVSGRSGTLASRFTGPNAAAAGAVRAKTGWIDTAYTLAGTIDAQDGTRLTFAFYAIGDVRDSARAALDTLTTAVWSCGGDLTTT